MSEALKDFATKQVKDPCPKGWEPSVTWNGQEGTITTGPLENEPDPAVWANLIADWGLDPAYTDIVDGSVQLRAWDANVGGGDIRRLKYYRVSIRSRQSAADRVDVDALCNLVLKRKPSTPVAKVDPMGRALIVALSDWQLGKGEGGGSEATAQRILDALDGLLQHIKELKRVGRAPQAIYLIGMGDIVERCTGHYPMQEFQTDLDERSQMRLGRRLLLQYVEALLKVEVPIVLGAVPGNHGENRRDGKAYTTWTDNNDLAVFEQVAEVLAANPQRYGCVSVPSGAIADDLTMTLDIAGIKVGFAHGHQMRSGVGGAQGKIEKWWHGQALGNQPVADAQILVTGHLHHFIASEATGRTIFQCPAMDGGSAWWTSTTGQSSPAGMLTFQSGTACGPRGWGDLRVL